MIMSCQEGKNMEFLLSNNEKIWLSVVWAPSGEETMLRWGLFLVGTRVTLRFSEGRHAVRKYFNRFMITMTGRTTP